jgi:[ribosomal protein S5]-alanine N-acetyltransferase
MILWDARSGISLIATEFSHLDAEDNSAEALCGLLNVSTPPSWPPEYNGPETRAWLRNLMTADAGSVGWLGYYVIATGDGQPLLAGTAGFKGRPDENGEVEIGYSIIPELHRKGIATAAVKLLIVHAFANPDVRRIKAETLPRLIPSIGVLIKCGFMQASEGFDPEEGKTLLFALDGKTA